jgi:hypothetical protein
LRNLSRALVQHRLVVPCNYERCMAFGMPLFLGEQSNIEFLAFVRQHHGYDAQSH